MNLKCMLLVVLLALSLSAAGTISVVNTANSAISPSAVVKDNVTVTIIGAAPNALITLNYTYNGTPGVWNAAYTSASGNWLYSAAAPSSQIGLWTEQWTVGGSNIGPKYTFEIVDVPSSVTRSIAGSSPNCCGSSYTPPDGTSYSTKPYGPSATIRYQIVGASGSNETILNTGLGILMEPEESLNGDPYMDIGCTAPGCYPGWLWTPPSAKYASSAGIFYDVPYALCGNLPFSGASLASQTIGIKIGNSKPYPVATVNETGSSTSPGHGTLTGTFYYSQ